MVQDILGTSDFSEKGGNWHNNKKSSTKKNLETGNEGTRSNTRKTKKQKTRKRYHEKNKILQRKTSYLEVDQHLKEKEGKKGWMDGWMDGWYGLMDGWIDGWIDG